MARVNLRVIGFSKCDGVILSATFDWHPKKQKPTGKLARVEPLHPTLVRGPDGEYVRDKDGKHLFRDENGHFYEWKDVIGFSVPVP